MATAKSLNIRQADALERIKAALAQIQAQTGIDGIDIDPRHKNEDIKQTLQIEAFADALGSVAGMVAEMSQLISDWQKNLMLSADEISRLRNEVEALRSPPTVAQTDDVFSVEVAAHAPTKAKRK